MLKENLIESMKEYFGEDQERIKHSLKVTDFAEKLIELHDSEVINEKVIIFSAILHDVGIKKAEAKYGSSVGKYQEIEGPPIAREILSSFNINKDIVEEICEIIGNHHSPGSIDSDNFKILYDADWLVNLPQTYNLYKIKEVELKSLIERVYLTETGKSFAENLLLE